MSENYLFPSLLEKFIRFLQDQAKSNFTIIGSGGNKVKIAVTNYHTRGKTAGKIRTYVDHDFSQKELLSVIKALMVYVRPR